ncbi:MAG TPA: DUF1028 domain-containing protein [Casimicrobiaceae bacterium]|nr:DUF1028 domain-containing protein [Casimicrobiaceae bacterium]
MTWSIIARDASGALGIAIASRFFAVGALCPHVRSGVGAVATQALVNPNYGPAALDLLAQGVAPHAVIERLVSADEGRDHRQVHLVHAQGISAAHTGGACIEWCGHRGGAEWSVAGNMLTGPEVLEATASAFERHRNEPFAERLLRALEAGDAAGGDKRGRQAAALVICTTETYPALDLRVDDHDESIRELRRLYHKSFDRFQPFLSCLPTRTRPAGITDRAEIERVIEQSNAVRAGAQGPRG